MVVVEHRRLGADDEHPMVLARLIVQDGGVGYVVEGPEQQWLLDRAQRHVRVHKPAGGFDKVYLADDPVGWARWLPVYSGGSQGRTEVVVVQDDEPRPELPTRERLAPGVGDTRMKAARVAPMVGGTAQDWIDRCARGDGPPPVEGPAGQPRWRFEDVIAWCVQQAE